MRAILSLMLLGITMITACAQPAQPNLSCSGNGQHLGQCVPVRSYADGTDIGKAMDICEEHSSTPSYVYSEGNTPVKYDHGWEACYKVRDEWNKSEAARLVREEHERIQRDKEFVESIAKNIGKSK
jgi:hypothetical protein